MGSQDVEAQARQEGGGLVSYVSDLPQAVSRADGLRPGDASTVRDLLDVWRRKRKRNALRSAYYSMHRRPRELGISVPPNLRSLEQVIGWPAKAVDALAARSQFDGFVSDDGDAQASLQRLVSANGLKRAYRKAVISELKHSCSFLTVTAGEDGEPPVVRCYPATGASALWSPERNRIASGLVVVDYDSRPNRQHLPTWVNVFTDDAVIRVRFDGRVWRAEYLEHGMGRCLMEPLAYDATLERPFGKSRISRAVMNITDDAMRESLRSEVSAEFFTSPQKYLLGADKEALGGESKWDAYIGSIFAVSKDEFGETPQFGQLAQGSMQPHSDYMRMLAARFSGETDVPISSLGVVSDNPSSAEAIYAAKEDLVVDAQNLNADNGEALRNVAVMALAIERGTDFRSADERSCAVQARFRNPAMPSVVSQSDAVTKMIASMPWLADSDVALEEYGFSDDQIQRLRGDRDKSKANAALRQIMNGGAADAGSARGSGVPDAGGQRPVG